MRDWYEAPPYQYRGVLPPPSEKWSNFSIKRMYVVDDEPCRSAHVPRCTSLTAYFLDKSMLTLYNRWFFTNFESGYTGRVVDANVTTCHEHASEAFRFNLSTGTCMVYDYLPPLDPHSHPKIGVYDFVRSSYWEAHGIFGRRVGTWRLLPR